MQPITLQIDPAFFILGLLVAVGVGAFTAGALIYRNNAKRFEKLLQESDTLLHEARKRLGDLMNKVS